MRAAADMLLVALAALAFAGCLRPDNASDPQPCAANVTPAQVPELFMGGAGSGPRALEVDVLDSDGEELAGAAVTAWWQDASPNGSIHVVRARAGEHGGIRLNVAGDTPVHLLAGLDSWTHEALVAARATVPIGSDGIHVTLLPGEVVGQRSGTWLQPATVGNPMPAWDPDELPWGDAQSLARLQHLELTLTWTNTVEGGADFGVAVGSGPSFQYWNQATQAMLGTFTEVLDLERATLDEFGWTSETHLLAGPSISTGGFSATGIPYTLAWDAHFELPDDLGRLCETVGNVPVIDDSSPFASAKQ